MEVMCGPHRVLLDDEDFDALVASQGLSLYVLKSRGHYEAFVARRFRDKGPHLVKLVKTKMGIDVKTRVDYVDGNWLNCQRSNLVAGPWVVLHRYAKASSIRRGRDHQADRYEFTATPADLQRVWEAQDGCCAFTGKRLTIWPRQSSMTSLDRIDSTRGYLPDNIQWVYRPLNYMKGSMPNEEFIELCQAVSAHARDKRRQMTCDLGLSRLPRQPVTLNGQFALFPFPAAA